MMLTSEKPNSGTENYKVTAKFYKIRLSLKESFITKLCLGGASERNFCLREREFERTNH